METNVTQGTGVNYSRATFTKDFVVGDLVFVNPTTIRCRCFLNTAEVLICETGLGRSVNNDGFGNSPEFWEIGIFGPLQGGAVATIPTTTSIGGLTGMVAGDVGATITIWNSATRTNDGSYTILTVPGPTSVTVAGPLVVDATAAIAWSVSTRRLMVAYGTFPEVVKTAARQNESFVEISF